ncbi:cytochrome c family protein [Phreatobacter aquaticus]|uniref:Cytochrome c family protein n=1 Tax=Phreatobacter aquaticus TaxID=2570229 RepID=A0A4D7QJY9_9HYPH|nr:cytochrome c family protein [Phreatobacter aquaticus]QCK86283.1 cytochrome c family protein [Phreatobacter aquaticus]
MRIIIASAAGLLLSASIASAQDAPPHPGQAVFAQCRACHQVGPTARNGVGPQLNGLFGRTAGSVAGYNYSPAYKTPEVTAKVWSEENFAAYIRDPRTVTPGTRMVFAGLRNDDQIKNLIGYLALFNPDGSPRAAAAATPAAPAAATPPSADTTTQPKP